jgi:hypothetical protein
MFMHKYKVVSVYFDKTQKLIGVPCGECERYGYQELDIFFVLEPIYTDDELETFLMKVFDECFSKDLSIDLTARSRSQCAMQKYTGAKSGNAAVKGYQLMHIDWIKDEYGYTFRPMMVDKKHKGAFTAIKGIVIKVSQHNKFVPIEKGALAIAFRKTMEIIVEQG